MNDGMMVTIKPRTVGLVILQMIFMIVMAIWFMKLFNEKAVVLEMKASGSGWGMMEISESGKDAILGTLYKAVAASIKGDNVKKSEVVIRGGSSLEKYVEEFDVHFVNFIADIPELERSFQVYYEWSDDAQNAYVSPNENVVAMCVNDEQMIYDKFDCGDEIGSQQAVTNNWLYRYKYKMPGHDNIIVMPGDTNGAGDETIMIKYVTCDSQCDCKVATEAEKRSAIAAFKEFVKGFGFSLEDIACKVADCAD